MSIFPPLCSLSVFHKCDVNLAAIALTSAWKPYCCGTSGQTTSTLPLVFLWDVSTTSLDIFLRFRPVLSDVTQHSFLLRLCEANLLICRSCLHTQWNSQKTSCDMKGHQCCNGGTTQLLYSFLPSYCFCCSPNGAECWGGRVWNNSFHRQRNFLSCLLVIAFCGWIRNRKPT